MQPSRIVTVLMLSMLLAFGPTAGVAAQGDEALVAISGVESQAFPQVTVSVAVSDASGPLEGLTAADFRVFEEGTEIPANTIAVESDTSQELRLVLVLDVSMKADSLAQIKDSAKDFIDTLGSPDKVALVAFYDQAKLVQDFTNNKDVLKTAVDGLTAQGNYSAFNQATFEAVTRASALSTGRKAVIVLTNSADNIGGRSANEVIDQARAARIAIYTIGFDRAAPDGLKSFATGTGGQTFFLPNLDTMPDSFQTIAKSLKQGEYQVTFRSRLKADGKEHALVVGVRKKGLAEGRFAAVPGQVTVSLPGLVDGQQVGGVVNLAAQATAPAPIAVVTYWLNDRLLGEVTAPPYNLEWDSTTLQPSTYRLVARAVDQAGNAGEAALNLKLTQPVVVTASLSQPQVKVGTPFTVTAKVDAFALVSRVDFLLDGQLMGSDSTPPYAYVFNSKSYSTGDHFITVRALDSGGRMAQARLTVQFLAPPPAPFPWSKLLVVAGVIIGALAIVVLAALGLAAIVRAQKRPKVFQLEIANLGNTYSHYRLRAEEPMDALKFGFALNGVRLPQCLEPQTAEVVPQIGTEAPISPAVPATPPTRGDGGGVGRTANQAVDGGSAAVDSMWSLGNVLPGSVSVPLQRALNPVYRTQSAVKGTRFQAQRAASQAAYVSQAAGAKPVSPSAGDMAQPSRTPARRQVAPAVAAFHSVAETWVETPLVAPGATLMLDLLISPLNFNRTQRYSFKVMSRAAEQEDAPLLEEGHVQIEGIPWLHRLLPYLGFAICASVVVLAAAFLLMALSIWGR